MKLIAILSALSVGGGTLAHADAPAARWEPVVLSDMAGISLRVCEGSGGTDSAVIRSPITPAMPTKEINRLRIGAPPEE